MCKRPGKEKRHCFVVFFVFSCLLQMFLCLRIYKIIPFYPGSYFVGEKETLFSQESFDKENMLQPKKLEATPSPPAPQ